MRLHLPRKEIIQALAVLTCLVFPAVYACRPGPPKAERPVIVRGILDLRNWNFAHHGALALDGRWEFYRDRLLEPGDFKNTPDRGDRTFIAVPGLWKNRAINGTALPGKGRATYRLRILTGSDTTVKTLVVNRIYSGYRLWINGALADAKGSANGSPKTRADYVFVYNKGISSFTPNAGMNEIVLQVFNDSYESGGIDRSIRLEDGAVTAHKKSLKYSTDMIVVGLLLFASVYNILFFFFRREEKAPLYFGFFCLIWTVNIFNLQSPILSGPLSNPRNPYLLDYVTIIACIPFCAMTIRSLFPEEFSPHAARLSWVASAGVIISLFPVEFITSERIVKGSYIAVILFISYSMYVFIRAIRNRRDGAVLFLAGFALMFLGGVNDILYSMWIIDTANITQYGIVAICLSTTMAISRQFSGAFRTVERLSKDLTEKNLALTRIDRFKDQFLAATSHELRTPLHGMIGLSDSMLDGTAGGISPAVRENLALISSSGRRLAGMVNDLLDMARIQEGGLRLDLRPVDLRALCEMVVKLSLPLAGKKPLKIINGIGPDIPRVSADEDRIRQVLHNLVGNAVKFTREGTIEITARAVRRGNGNRDGAEVEVSVSDTGIGVPDGDRERIFEAYRQLDAGDTRSYSGTGLGLAIARRIIELHNGEISVSSGKNGGSVFSFTLAVSDGYMTDIPDENDAGGTSAVLTPGESADRPGAAGADIVFENSPALLVVDDDPVNVRIISNYLESKDCVVKTASDGASALDILEHDTSIDLVLLDIMMPVMSGYEVCRRIRATRTPEELPVIMLTAKNMLSDIDAAYEAGANDYIMKPFRISELLARVNTMLKLRNIRKPPVENITIRGKNRAYSIILRDIIYITSHSKNIVIHTGEGDIEAPVLMKEIIHRLPPDIFIRVHKSHIINIRYIHSLIHVRSGRYRVRLRDEDDTELPVGPAFLEALRKRI